MYQERPGAWLLCIFIESTRAGMYGIGQLSGSSPDKQIVLIEVLIFSCTGQVGLGIEIPC